MTEEKPDPIEGFHFTGYDPATGKLTIELHASILKHKPSIDALQIKAIKIMTEGGGVAEVEFKPRSSD